MRILLALFLALIACGLRAQTFSSLEERMSTTEFKAAGLDKLSAEELAALNAWLQARASGFADTAPSASPASRVANGDRVGFKDSSERRSVVSRIAGPFKGWSGNTTFVLENGQVWQQAEAASLVGADRDSPAVTIDPAFMGSWRLRVEGFNQRVRVRRIQ